MNTPKTPKNSGRQNTLYLFYIIAFLFILGLFFFNRQDSGKEISWLEFENQLLHSGDIDRIVIVNKEVAEIFIHTDRLSDDRYKDVAPSMDFQKNPQYIIHIGSIDRFETKLDEAQENLSPEQKIEVVFENRTGFSSLLPWLLPLLLIFAFYFFLFRGIGRRIGGGASAMNFGKTTAQLSDIDTLSKVTFDQVAGLKEAKVEIMEVVEFLKNPEEFTRLGAKIPKGILLTGPPGTGKTLLARAVAGEARVPFFSLSGSEFVEMFVGVGASRVRDLFKRAKEKSPCIIFIDEIDAIGRSRDKVKSFQSNDERENTLNQLLAELDGFGTNTGVIVLAATNRPDILDKALLRAGRFDRHIYLELPSKTERIEIFNVHLKPLKIETDVDVETLAYLTPGFSGADIANLCNEAALMAARHKQKKVRKIDFDQARERIMGGLERKSKIISPEEKNIVAHHEAGHAVAGWFLPHVDPLVKVTIIPRGQSLGAAWYLPEERQIITRSQFRDRICAALAGRAAEEIIFDEISSGALDDLERVTKQAYGMVAHYGLDNTIGPISFYDSSGEYERVFGKPYSEDMGKRIDDEVQKLIFTEYERAKELLIRHREKVENLAALLLEKETAEKEDLEKILGIRGEKKQTISPLSPNVEHQ